MLLLHICNNNVDICGFEWKVSSMKTVWLQQFSVCHVCSCKNVLSMGKKITHTHKKKTTFQLKDTKKQSLHERVVSFEAHVPPIREREEHLIISAETSPRDKPSFCVWLLDSHLTERLTQKQHSIHHQQLSKYRNLNNRGAPWPANQKKPRLALYPWTAADNYSMLSVLGFIRLSAYILCINR